MYAEEADLSFRMAAAGWQTHFAPVTDVVHYGGASTRQQRAAMLAQGCASTLQFYRRHYSGFRLAQAMFAMRCGMAARLARDGARYVLSAQAGQRNELLENVGVWRRFAFGGLTADQRH